MILAAHIPLKQGLRLLHTCFFRCSYFLAAHIPLKQGLRQLNNFNHCFRLYCRHIHLKQDKTRFLTITSRYRCFSLAAHIPLKQRLRRPFFSSLFGENRDLAAHIPLKQGLRRLVFYCYFKLKLTRSAYSTKTRIKTLIG